MTVTFTLSVFPGLSDSPYRLYNQLHEAVQWQSLPHGNQRIISFEI